MSWYIRILSRNSSYIHSNENSIVDDISSIVGSDTIISEFEILGADPERPREYPPERLIGGVYKTFPVFRRQFTIKFAPLPYGSVKYRELITILNRRYLYLSRSLFNSYTWGLPPDTKAIDVILHDLRITHNYEQGTKEVTATLISRKLEIE